MFLPWLFDVRILYICRTRQDPRCRCMKAWMGSWSEERFDDVSQNVGDELVRSGDSGKASCNDS